jgi:alkaline phosphatase
MYNLKYSKPLLSCLIGICCLCISAQGQKFTLANVHSHNDYEQKIPFELAYTNQLGSIEADIHLVGGKILVGHDAKDLLPNRSLENLYLAPLLAYNTTSRKLQLLIDVKTEAIRTLDSLIALLKQYPSLINNKNITITISGNTPPDSIFIQYPKFIHFDGRIFKNYTPEQLSKISLISEDYGKFTMWKKTWPMQIAEEEKIKSAIKKIHALNKPIRLWGTPDFPLAWEKFIAMKIDFINTDKIEEITQFFQARP